MEITQITLKNMMSFEKVLPPLTKYQDTYMCGCVIDDKAVGSAVMYIFEEYCSIGWLWVANEYRRQGVGERLLDRLCESAGKEYKRDIIITYSSETSWAVVMEYLLLRKGFTIEIRTYPKFCFTSKQLLSSPLMKRSGVIADSRVVSLAELSQIQIKDFLAAGKENVNYHVTGMDFVYADKERSMALIYDGRIQGLVLVGTLGAENVLSLNLFYLNKVAGNGALLLLHHTAQAVISHPAGLHEFYFLCTDDITVKICRQLMGEKETLETELCHGIMIMKMAEE